MHVDGAYSTVRAQTPTLLTFYNSPPLGYQRSSRSDIRPQTFLEKLPGVEQLRNVKRWIQPLLRP